MGLQWTEAGPPHGNKAGKGWRGGQEEGLEQSRIPKGFQREGAGREAGTGGGGVPWPWALAPAPCSAEDSSSSGSIRRVAQCTPSGQTPGRPGKGWGVEPWRAQPTLRGLGLQVPQDRAQADPAERGRARAVLQDPHPSTDQYLLISPDRPARVPTVPTSRQAGAGRAEGGLVLTPAWHPLLAPRRGGR